jgi:protein-S-isoprenylcysteine O-methyltransferase Ste14
LQTHIAPIFIFPQALPFWIVAILVMIPEIRIFRNATKSPVSSQDAGTIRIIKIGGQVASLAGFAVSFLPWFVIPWSALSLIVGTCFVLAAGILRQFCFRALGKYFTGAVIVSKDQPVIERGPYRWVRHPGYTAGFLLNSGIGIALGSWLSVIILFLSTCYIYSRRVKAEEKALLETIGEPYRAYMSRTKRFIPFLV